MNLYELVTTVLKQCRLDPTDATDRSDNQNSVIVPALNEAYRRMCREKAHPWTTEAITLDANKCFDTRTLTNKLVRIIEISQYQDYSSAAGGARSSPYAWDKYDGSGTIVIPTATASGTVYIKYEYMPAKLDITYNISDANTVRTIPVNEAITAAQATALIDQTLYVIDVSSGLYTEYTIESALAGVAGAATITVNETIDTATEDGDEIYIGANWEPVVNEDWHTILTYWATAQYYLARGANYTGMANMWLGIFDREFANITDSIGEEEVVTGAYSTQI